MGPGIFLMVVGALLAFAVEDHVPNLNLPVAGVILMIAGAVLIVHDQRTSRRTVVRRDESTDPDEPTHIVEETVEEQPATDSNESRGPS
jgi:membrane protein implicated in regulation of membrane protease activity